MATLAELKTASDADAAADDVILTKLTNIEAQLAGLSGSTTLSPADQALVDGMLATLQAQTAKKNAAA